MAATMDASCQHTPFDRRRKPAGQRPNSKTSTRVVGGQVPPRTRLSGAVDPLTVGTTAGRRALLVPKSTPPLAFFARIRIAGAAKIMR